MEPVALRAGSLVLDQPTEADIPFITLACQDPLFEDFLTLPWPYRTEHAEFFVNEYVPGGWSRGDEVTWALRIGGEFLGVVGVRAENSMIGFWLSAEHRGHGYMPRAVTAVLDWVFASGWSSIVRWEAVEGNTASSIVARKTGFRYTGVGPALVRSRDGSAPSSWQAEICADDDRSESPGWPELEASISLILFDLDDTLFAHREAVDHAITVHRASLDNAAFTADDASEIRRWRALEEEHYHRYLSGELDFRGQRVARARDFVAAYGTKLDDAGANRWYDDYYREYEKAWTLHKDALPTFDELRSAIPGVQFGLITNGELGYQSLKVAAVGLDRLTKHLIASGDVGIAKPDERIFHHACALFGVPPSAAVYVGDRLNTDALGAAKAGLTGVWLDRHGLATQEELATAAASKVVVIRSLTELSTALSTVLAT